MWFEEGGDNSSCDPEGLSDLKPPSRTSRSYQPIIGTNLALQKGHMTMSTLIDITARLNVQATTLRSLTIFELIRKIADQSKLNEAPKQSVLAAPETKVINVAEGMKQRATDNPVSNFTDSWSTRSIASATAPEIWGNYLKKLISLVDATGEAGQARMPLPTRKYIPRSLNSCKPSTIPPGGVTFKGAGMLMYAVGGLGNCSCCVY
jgi:hypothetical protein